jgi:hypothetical protein
MRKYEGRRGEVSAGRVAPIPTGRGTSNNINNNQQLGNEARANTPAPNSRRAEWLGLEKLLSVVEVVSNFTTRGERGMVRQAGGGETHSALQPDRKTHVLRTTTNQSTSQPFN